MINVAFVGKPNSGKTSLFNIITGSRQKTANYAGVTVERKYSYWTSPHGDDLCMIDLPGIYSLNTRTLDEKVTKDVLSGVRDDNKIDIIVAILDATNMQHGLRFLYELRDAFSLPIVVAVNMMDLARKGGYVYDLDALSEEFSCVFIETSAYTKEGVSSLLEKISEQASLCAKQKMSEKEQDKNAGDKALQGKIYSSKDHKKQEEKPLNLALYHKKASTLLERVVIKKGQLSDFSRKVDRFLLHPVFGWVFLFLLLFVVFQSVFSIATIPQDFLQSLFDQAQAYVLSLDPGSLVLNLLGNGIIAGVGTVIVFLPQIITMMFFVYLLEDSGYMARVAFLLDRLMGVVGLQGKAFIPLLSSFACAIPGIMATRTIERERDRIMTILISPLMTCSARIPVYTLLISAFIPRRLFFGFINLQGLVMLALYLTGIVFCLLMAWILDKVLKKGENSLQLLEIPSYKRPRLYNILIGLYGVLYMFLKRAGTTILALMIVIWFLSTFPSAPADAIYPAIHYSFAGIIGRWLEPLFAPIGFHWQIVVSLIPAMAAREVAITSLATIYAVAGGESGLGHVLLQHWSLATALSLLAWYVFAPQCISTLAVAKRETNSLKWPMIMFAYQIVLAYAASLVVYHFSLWIIGG